MMKYQKLILLTGLLAVGIAALNLSTKSTKSPETTKEQVRQPQELKPGEVNPDDFPTQYESTSPARSPVKDHTELEVTEESPTIIVKEAPSGAKSENPFKDSGKIEEAQSLVGKENLTPEEERKLMTDNFHAYILYAAKKQGADPLKLSKQLSESEQNDLIRGSIKDRLLVELEKTDTTP